MRNSLLKKQAAMPRSQYDKVCYTLATDPRLWDFFCAYTYNSDACDDYPEEYRKVVNLIKSLPRRSQRLYRGEPFRHGDDRLPPEWNPQRELVSWSQNIRTAKHFSEGHRGIVWETVGPIQGVGLHDIVNWRNRTHPHESNYGGSQYEWFVLSDSKVKECDPEEVRKAATSKPVTAHPAVDMGYLQGVLNELMGDVMPGLPLPNLKVVNNIKSRWNGRCNWNPPSDNGIQGRPALYTNGQQTTLIELQKAICHDETTLRKILAHELCHHEQFLGHWSKLSPREYRTMYRIEGGHGKTWLDIAARWNAKYGDKFVTVRSDETHEVLHDETPFFVFFWKSSAGLRWQSSVVLTPKAMKYMYTEGKKNPAVYKLVKTTDRNFLRKQSIDGGFYAYSREPEVMAEAENLWTNSPDLLQSVVADRFDKPDPNAKPFFVFIQKQEHSGRMYVWQKAIKLNDAQLQEMKTYSRRRRMGHMDCKLVMSTNLLLKAAPPIGGYRISYPRNEDETAALMEAWNSPDVMDKYVPPEAPKTASPDFGYSAFNDREADLAKVEFSLSSVTGNSFQVDATYEGKLIAWLTSYAERGGSFHYPDYTVDAVNIMDKSWKGTGVGQMLYDKAIEEAKKREATYFYSDTGMKDAARSAWQRLKLRYPVESLAGQAEGTEHYNPDKKNKGLTKVPRYRIDLSKVASPDFGYSQYNDRDKDLATLKWTENSFGWGDANLAATKDGHHVGDMSIGGYSYDDDYVYVVSVDIDEEWRGTGLGQMLYDKAIEYAKRIGAQRLYAGGRSKDAMRAWDRLAQRYTVIEDPEHYDVPYIDLTGEMKTASPDFGYSQYNDRDKDLKHVKISLVSKPPRGEGDIQLTAEYDGWQIGGIDCWKVARLCTMNGIYIESEWRGTGLGQMLYDAAIQAAKKAGCRYFQSDGQLRNDAVSAWLRLAKRYHVEEVDNPEFLGSEEKDEDDPAGYSGYDNGEVGQHPVVYQIDLNTVPLKTKGRKAAGDEYAAAEADPFWERIKVDFMAGIVYHGTTVEVAEIVAKTGFRGLDFDAIVADVLAKHGLTEVPKRMRKVLEGTNKSYTGEHGMVSTCPGGHVPTLYAGAGGEVPKQVEAYVMNKYRPQDVKVSLIKGDPAIIKCRIKNFEGTEYYRRVKQLIDGMRKMIDESTVSGHSYTEREAAEYLWRGYNNLLCKPEDLEVLEVITGPQVEELAEHPLGVNLA